MKINWKQKLTSRKLWLAVAGFITGLVTAITAGTVATEIGGLVMAFGSVVAYIFGEGYVDANR